MTLEQVLAVLTGLVLILLIALLLTLLAVVRLRRRLADVRRQGRSRSTRYGQITEQFAPWMESWPWDPKGFRFIGTPIDGIQFTDDGVVLVEIKSNRSSLSTLQRRIRDQVQAGQVTWQEVRIG